MDVLAHVDEIVHGRVVAGVGAAVVLSELVLLIVAARRGPRPPLAMSLHVSAGLAILALPLVTAVSVHAARAMTVAALTHAAAPVEQAGSVSRGLAGQVNAFPFLAATSVLATMLWFGGLAFTISRPRPDGRPRALPPVLLVVPGLLPVAYGALGWCTTVIHRLATLSGRSGDERAVLVSATIDAARAGFEHAAQISMVAIPILGAAAIAIVLLRDRARRPSLPAQPSAGRATLALAGAFALGAVLLVVGARPMARENLTPWPPLTFGPRLASAEPPTPDLVGPDPAEWAPVITVTADRLALDAAAVDDADALYERLDWRRINAMRLDSVEVSHRVVLVADAATAMSRLRVVLRAVLRAECNKPLFTFTKATTIVRPTVGTLQRVDTSAAAAKLVYADATSDDDDEAEAARWKDAVTLRPVDFATYDAFARRLVELRRAGKPVIVPIGLPIERAP
jgi:hypothetical protein